jgi:addiction module HigA family antidote
MNARPPAIHPGRLLKRELNARGLSANRLALDIGVPSSRVTDILNGRLSITADTDVRLGRHFGNSAQFWLDLQGQLDSVASRPRRAAGGCGAKIGSVGRSETTQCCGAAALATSH